MYVDTSVLVAASVLSHPHHGPAFDLVDKATHGKLKAVISSHGLAEFYAVLTRTPFVPRVHPHEAGRILEEVILVRFEVSAISTEDYKAVLRSCIHDGLSGSIVYDKLHLHCAKNWL